MGTGRIAVRMFTAMWVLAAASHPAWAQKSPWAVEWKSKDAASENLTVTFENITREGFSWSFNEGIGINGASGEGVGRFTSATEASGTVKDSDCRYKFTLRGKELTVVSCGGMTNMSEPKDVYVFVSAAAPRTYPASFDCAKAGTAIEKGICADRALAGLDKSLGEVYGALRKTLPAAEQDKLRAGQREWLSRRDKECAPLKQDMAGCLMRHYGIRLFQARAWHEFGLWIVGPPDFASASAVAKAGAGARKEGVDLLGMGMAYGLNLSSYFETNSIQRYQTQVRSDEVVQFAVTQPDPSRGYDPQSFDRNIALVVHKTLGTWVGVCDAMREGIEHEGEMLYAQKGRTLKDLPPGMKSWVEDVSRQQKRKPNIQFSPRGLP